MAGAQISIVANQIDKQRLGYMGLSLTNYDATTEPQIAAGSIVEVAGALFEFASAESITGWSGIGTSNDVYIKLVVAGTAVTAEFTTTAPTWSTSKQGWYGTAGAALDRYVAKLYKDGSGNYTEKRILSQDKSVDTGTIVDGAISASKLQDECVLASSIKLSGSSTGNESVAAGATWTPASGLYMVTTPNNAFAVEIYDGSWRTSFAGWTGGMIFCDGSNMRVKNTSGSGPFTLYYRKMA